MSIFRDLVLSRPVKTNLEFGHNENVVISKIDFGVRKNNGIAIRANTFITLAKINPEDRAIKAQTEINFWNLDPTKDFVFSNFIEQFTALYGIVDALGGDAPQFESDVLDNLEGEDDDETTKFLKAGDNAKTVQTKMVDAFKSQVESLIGLNSKLLKCKMVSNKAGFLQQGGEIDWILPMDSENDLPIVSSKEKGIRRRAMEASNEDKKAKPDKVGDAPSGESSVAGDSLDAL